MDSITFSGLDGDTDKLYVMQCFIKIGGPSATTYSVAFKPNNITTNQISFSRSTNSSATTINGYASSTWNIANASRGAEYFITINAFTSNGYEKMFSATQAVYSTALFVGDNYMFWNNTSTNLTSIVLAGSSTGVIDVGSEFHLYKRTV